MAKKKIQGITVDGHLAGHRKTGGSAQIAKRTLMPPHTATPIYPPRTTAPKMNNPKYPKGK